MQQLDFAKGLDECCVEQMLRWSIIIKDGFMGDCPLRSRQPCLIRSRARVRKLSSIQNYHFAPPYFFSFVYMPNAV
jgi:hypothetical protein